MPYFKLCTYGNSCCLNYILPYRLCMGADTAHSRNPVGSIPTNLLTYPLYTNLLWKPHNPCPTTLRTQEQPKFYLTKQLKNRNIRKNWAQRLQKKLQYFPNKNYKQSRKHLRFSPNFNYGNAIFLPPKALLLSALFLVRFTLNLKRVIRKRDKTLRKF